MSKKENAKIFKTLEEVQDWAFKMMKKKEYYIYRGQGDSSWSLNSGHSRILNTKMEYKDEVEKFEFIKRTFIQKIEFLKKQIDNLKDLALLGEMQHHGQVTPLIDFTEDILVALWFAASHIDEIEKTFEDKKSFRIYYLKKEEGSHQNELNIEKIKINEIQTFKFNTGQQIGRSISQKSIFIFDSINLDTKVEYIDVKNDFVLKLDIISWLKKLGIDSMSIYPDIEGVFKSFDFVGPDQLLKNGFKLLESNRFDEAILKFKEVIKIDANNANSYLYWGFALNKLGRDEEAIEKFKEVIKIDLNFADAYYNWGVVLGELGKFEEAIEKYQKVIKIDPNDVSAYNNWGFSLVKLGKDEEGIEKFKEVIKIDPSNASAYVNWGVALGELGKDEEAIEKFKEVIKIDPSNASAYVNWGVALGELGKFEEAIEKYQEVIKIDKNNTDAYSNWGVALNKLGRKEEAEEKFEIAKKLSNK